MRLTQLHLRDFRNYASAALEPSPSLNLLVGPNAQGKTNLLEAIWVLSGARSPRAADQGQLVRSGAGRAAVWAALVLDASGARRELRMELASQGPRTFWVNGRVLRRHADALGVLAVLWFSPDEVDLVRGAPAQRRRFVDLALSQADPLYRDALVRYARILQQRNRLLRPAPRGAAPPPEVLEPWDAQLAECGGELVARRIALVQALAPAASDAYRSLAGGGEALALHYFCSAVRQAPADPGLLRERILERLRALRSAELARGATLVGPHRDDVAILLGPADLRRFGSRGEQRTAAVALFVAAWRWMHERTGEAPVLLLDDVASELDEPRRRRLGRVLPAEAQVFATATDLALLPLASDGRALRVWRVSAGRLELVPGR